MNIISKNAKIGKNVQFGNFVTVYDNVEIGDNSIIESYSEIGYSNGKEKDRLRIGNNAHVRSHSIIYAGTLIGDNFISGHHVVIRENMQIGNNCQIGTFSDLQGESSIGNFVRIHSHAQINQFSKIGHFVWIFPYVIFINDPHPPSDGFTKGPEISDYAALGAGSIIFPDIKVGKGSLVGAGCVLKNDLPDEQIAVGNPGKIIGSASKIMLKDKSKPAYPWKEHFHRGYPKEIIDKWMNE